MFTSFIKKSNPVCINCIHYLKYSIPYDEIYDKTKIGLCFKFEKENLVTGEISYEDAMICRITNSKCGETGKFYIPKNRII